MNVLIAGFHMRQRTVKFASTSVVADKGAIRRWRSKTNRMEQDDDEGAIRRGRSKAKMKEQDEDGGARRG